MSHTGKALMDVLETYPRDELFQTPLEELVPIAKAVLHTRERRQLRLFVRRDAYRPLPLLPGLPAAGPLQHRACASGSRASSSASSAASTVEYTARVSESMLARLHFVVRPPKGETMTADVDVADLERRLAEAARSWQDDFVAAVREEYGEAQGARLARTLRRLVPRGLQGGLPAAHRRGRPRPARGLLEGDEGGHRAVLLPADGLRRPARRG